MTKRHITNVKVWYNEDTVPEWQNYTNINVLFDAV